MVPKLSLPIFLLDLFNFCPESVKEAQYHVLHMHRECNFGPESYLERGP